MKLEKKHFLPAIFTAIIFLFLGYYVYSYLVEDKGIVLVETKQPAEVAQVLPPLSKEDEVLANEVFSVPPEPLSKEDEVTAANIMSPESALKPLTPLEEEQARKIFGI
jgi:hypothetical protein